MIRTLRQTATDGVTWIDVTEPTTEELHALAAEHGFHAMAIEDSLDPWHLPKFERIDDATFLILRVFGERPDRTGNTVQDMTRKIAVFLKGDTVITIHRAPQPVCDAVARDHTHPHLNGAHCGPGCLVVALIHGVLESYDAPLDRAEDQLNQFETDLFDPKTRSPALEEIHALKGTVGTIRRLMWQTLQVIQKLLPPTERSGPAYQDLRETVESYHFQADQLLEEAQNLVSIHLAVASHRTNEVMRVLTVFSAFFLPLTFIVGVYGMNFEFMPELTRQWGYPAVLLFMAGVSLGIGIWFRRRGWLGRGANQD